MKLSLKTIVSETKAARLELEKLWPLGLVFFAAFLSYAVFWKGKPTSNFPLYLSCPVFLVILLSASLWSPWKGWVRKGLGWMAWLIPFLLLICRFRYGALLSSVLSLFFLSRSRIYLGKNKALWFFVLWFGWHSVLRFHWLERPFHFISHHWDTALVYLLSLVGVLHFLLVKSPRGKSVWKWAVASVVLGIASFQLPRVSTVLSVLDQYPGVFNYLTDFGLFNYFHHWGVYVGVAELLQQGGELYWDVPSQYGFLSILSWVYLPFGSAWENFYIFQAVCLCCTSLILFYFLSKYLQWGFALLLCYAAIFVVPGWAFKMLGIYAFPSSGAVRFIWIYFCFVFIRSLNQKANLLGMVSLTAVWILGSFWSAESFVMVQCLYWPFYLNTLWVNSSHGTKLLRGNLFLWVLAPLLAFMGCLAAVFWVWFDRFGHFPEWTGFFEYALSYSAGFSRGAITPTGGVWYSIGWLGLILAYSTRFLSPKVKWQETPIFIALAGGLWAISSHYFGRGHDNNFLNVVPLYLLIGILFLECVKEEYFSRLGKLYLAPLISFTLTLAYGDLTALWATTQQLLYPMTVGIHGMVFRANTELQDLFNEAGVKSTDALVAFHSNLPPLFQKPEKHYMWKSWLPAAPLALLDPLPEESVKRYAERFLARNSQSGWLLSPIREGEDGLVAKRALFSVLERSHDLERTWESESWRLSYYRLKAESVSRPK